MAMRSVREAEPVLIWPRRCHREVGDEGVFGLAGAVGDDGRVAGLRRPVSMASRVSVTVPIWLSLIKIALATPSSMPALQKRRVGHEHIVAHQLHLRRQLLGQRCPAVPVVLGQTVLDRDDGVVFVHAQ